MSNWFEELNNVNVNDHIETKGNLSYLSWAWAWAELKKRYPHSFSTVYENDGSLLWRDPIGAHVKTGVTIVWEENGERSWHEAIEYLPVMDMRNNAKKYEDITAMDVNKTVQRSLTKCIARLGLGLYIYAGEDLPEEDKASAEAAKKAAEDAVNDLTAKINDAIATKTKTMSNDEKRAYADKVIVPIVGAPNYKKCRDAAKLEKLLAAVTAA